MDHLAAAAGNAAGAPPAVEIRIRGRVQGVGFRPTVWRLASELGLDGEVLNDGGGVLIRVNRGGSGVAKLLAELRRQPPPLARIEQIELRNYDRALPQGFRIATSELGPVRTEITPDAAVCAACAAEVRSPTERRHRYAFTNCTHCGPRLSIVRGIPYDRARTTMAPFQLCADCAAEYREPAERRFHAEPIACPACGPRLELVRLPDRTPIAGDPIADAARLLAAGAIVAIKGLGGYQLACDAADAAAVAGLRRRKHRDAKPFALMARDIAIVRRYCRVTPDEERLLQSSASPIVLLRADGPERLSEAVAPGLDTLGFMLPTTPLHLLLLGDFDRPVVMTSGNRSDEPQVTCDAELADRLGGIADYALMHDREIANRVDDSVVRMLSGKSRVLRRARGYAPAPIALPPGFEDAPEILAMGGELKTTFCVVKDGQAILSQHHGDLEHPAVLDDYRKNIALYRELFAHAPVALAADLHPEYLSGKLARELVPASGLPLIEVQHHHAHVAACLAENGRPRAAPPVIGIVLDGLGWGVDGTIWGGEFLLADYDAYQRLASLAPVPMPGAAQAVREPWRNFYAHVTRAMPWPELARRFGDLPVCQRLAAKPLAVIERMIAGGLNSPRASSCGRLFDAVAAALGICFERQAYEGEAAMRLEALVDRGGLRRERGYQFDTAADCVDPRPIWQPLLRDIAAATPRALIAARFHGGFAAAVAATAERLACRCGLNTVALSGGCFQNAVLLDETVRRIDAAGLTVLTHAAAPTNDGGLALGQAAVAAARLINGASRCA